MAPSIVSAPIRRILKEAMPTSGPSGTIDTQSSTQPHTQRSSEEKSHRKRYPTPDRMNQAAEQSSPHRSHGKQEPTRPCGWDGWAWLFAGLLLWAFLFYIASLKTPECKFWKKKHVFAKVCIAFRYSGGRFTTYITIFASQFCSPYQKFVNRIPKLNRGRPLVVAHNSKEPNTRRTPC